MLLVSINFVVETFSKTHKHTTAMRQFIKCAMTLMLFLTLYNAEAKAQFYSVNFVNPNVDTLSVSVDPYANGYSLFPGAKLVTKSPTKNYSKEKETKRVEKTFPLSKPKTRKMPESSLFNATDSLVLELIRKRLTVCMPLDLVHLTSHYGYRKDPFEKCTKFHDGIDLRAGHEVVYSMLPGKVALVKYGNTGYGNHLVIDHGKFRCLYAHLSEIYAKEGMIVDAGSIVAKTGESGRATACHLHLKLSKLSGDGTWISVNPMPFITSLNDYINEYNERLDLILGKNRSKEYEYLPELNVANLYAELKRQGVKHPKIVLAQAILESAWFKSDLTKSHNNIFGIRTRRGPYQRFEHWTESVTAYRDLVQYKFRDGKESYSRFLARIGYASDPAYINKVMEIANKL